MPSGTGRRVPAKAKADNVTDDLTDNVTDDLTDDLTAATRAAFDLPDRLAAKADPALIAADVRHFAALAAGLEHTIADLSARLDEARRAPGRGGQAALDRDQEIYRLTARLRTLRNYGLDLCLGRLVPADTGEPVYIGRLGLTDDAGRRLLVDWRAPAAEPFFAATHAEPMGLASRRRYRWTGGRISDYWDEVFTADGLAGHAALDDQSAFIASLGAARSPRMRDVLSTIAADQDAIVRAGARGALVVDGGPGTGKTVVALHRTAYLLYSDPLLEHRRGGVLFVGPHRAYLAYVGDVLPSLGEEGVRICTIGDFVPEGAAAEPESDPRAARLKAAAGMVEAIEPAVALYEQPPASALPIETPWAAVVLTAADWAEAFDSADPGTPHNEARDQILETLLSILTDKVTAAVADAVADDADRDPGDERVISLDDPAFGREFDAIGHLGAWTSGAAPAGNEPDDVVPAEAIRRSLRHNRDLARALARAWPMLEPTDIVGDLWTVPAYLRMCAPWLAPEEVAALRRADPAAWTRSDLPLLDAARRRLGDPEAAARRRRQEAAAAARREEMNEVIDHLIAADDSELMVMHMLRGQDLRDALVDDAAVPDLEPDALAGPFAHIVVDEAQELTDAEWHMLLARCPSRSFTIVGDRAQARHGFAESWAERLARIGLDHVEIARLTLNYRTPAEVMAAAEPVIRAVVPDANVPTSVRRTGVGVRYGSVADLDAVLADWLAGADGEGIACVVGDPGFGATGRVRSVPPEEVKGLEFDLVVLVEPDSFGVGIEGGVDRYVAMTRATQQLVILTG